jgi:uncharacterized membrane protein YkgB
MVVAAHPEAHQGSRIRTRIHGRGLFQPARQAGYQDWHAANNTYEFAYGLGAVIVAYGLLLCLHHPWLPQAALAGSFLVFIMSFVTLSFLITTPETWAPALGGPTMVFPI